MLFRLLSGLKIVCVMDNNYRKIVPEDVFVSILDREATEEELWMGLPRDFMGNRPSGNDFIDLFARLVRQYQSRDIEFYAKIMGEKKMIRLPLSLKRLLANVAMFGATLCFAFHSGVCDIQLFELFFYGMDNLVNTFCLLY